LLPRSLLISLVSALMGLPRAGNRSAPLMTSILELPTVRRQASRLSLDEYHRLGEFNENGRRTELVRGFVIEKMSKSPLHTNLLRRLVEIVRAAVATQLGLLVLKEDPLTLADSEPEPDISVVVGNEEDYAHAHPTTALLTVEISITTLELDRAKTALYAEAGVMEYWLVLPERGEIEAHTEPRDGVYRSVRVYATGETLRSTALPQLEVSLAGLFRA
jgi:Uma2 family endonuclease